MNQAKVILTEGVVECGVLGTGHVGGCECGHDAEAGDVGGC